MPASSPTDEQLRDRVLEQTWAGDFLQAQQTARGILDRQYLQQAWVGMLCIHRERGDVQGIKETIAACPDDSLLESQEYMELPLEFIRTGDISGAVEIANAMGRYGKFSLTLLPVSLAGKGDFVGARKAASQITDERTRNGIMKMVDQLQAEQKNTGPEESNPK